MPFSPSTMSAVDALNRCIGGDLNPGIGGPAIGMPSEKRLPVRMSAAAAAMRSGVKRLDVPRWSSSPHRPQLFGSPGDASTTLPCSSTRYPGGSHGRRGGSGTSRMSASQGEGELGGGAAVDDERLAGDVGGQVGAEEQHGLGDVLGLGLPSQ